MTLFSFLFVLIRVSDNTLLTLGIFACEEGHERTKKHEQAKDDSQTNTLTWKGLGEGGYGIGEGVVGLDSRCL